MSTAQQSSRAETTPAESPRAATQPHGRVVALPSHTHRPDVWSYLAEVDALLATAVADLHHLWKEGLEDHGTVDVLTDSDLPELLDLLLSSRGKRIRPVMAYLGWLSAGGHGDDSGRAAVVRVGAALELLHLFALVHDDVMDESASRRGHPTVHARAAALHRKHGALGSAGRFGESIAILLGDLAHAEADHLVTGLPAPMRRLWRLLVVELVCGQRRDLTGTAAGRRDLHHARQVARMKSGAYTVERPLQLGAVAARAPGAVVASLTRYGREVGEAFALRDDLLGVWGDPAHTGKPAGDDLISGKPTVILSLASQRLRHPVARQALDRAGTPELTAADVTLLQRELQRDGVVAAVEDLIAGHVAAALEALHGAALDPDGVTELTQMAHQIAWRDR
jgi:geranylgeranyl diphosphate synthase type I